MVENLVSYNAHHFEALLASDGIDDHVAMDADEMLRIKNAILILMKTSSARFHNKLAKEYSARNIAFASSSANATVACRSWGVELRRVAGSKGNPESTCPAVSIISVANSWFLYRIILLNVFSIVG